MASTGKTVQINSKIDQLINSSRFNESFLLLKREMKNYPSLAKSLDKILKLESTYRYMLDYITEGNVDPSQKDMIEQIRDALLSANSLLWREMTLKDSSDIYSSTRRMFALQKTNITSLYDEYRKISEEIFKSKPEEGRNAITASQSRIISDLFNYVWTMAGESEEEYDNLSSILESPEAPDYLKGLLTSAIILGNLSYFDPGSFEILLNIYENSNSSLLRARAISGILLISILNSKRIAGNLKIRSRLMLMSDDEELKRVINEGLISIIRTYDTTRIDNKMRNEVIPELMKIKPDLINKMRDLASDSENFLSEGNPQWEEFIENSDIGNKLQEINDMQLEGADVMVTAFSNLKNFPFFAQPMNWFLPFTPRHYEFASLPFITDDEMIERFSFMMCDSDLHSFLLSMVTMPEQQRQQMFNNLQTQMKEAKEVMTNSIGESDSQFFSRKMKHSLHDIYRFFKFFRKKSDFQDPFANPFLATQISQLMPVFGIEPAVLRPIAEFYFKNKYYDEAAGFFELIDMKEPGDFYLWEKIGFCHDRMHRHDKASEWYKKADLVNPGNKWLMKKLAISLKNAGKPEEAIPYYEKALENEPENYHLIMSAGQCLLTAGRTEDAIKHFYHANYLKPGKIDPQRAVAWAELIAGNTEKAKLKYEAILSSELSDKTDFLNAAHVALATGDFRNALKLYKTFVEKSENADITELLLALRDDSQTIKKLGIQTSDLRLIVDKIRYDRM